MNSCYLKPAQTTDSLKGILFTLCSWFLSYVDASKLYHVVRGQRFVLVVFYSVIKLYVIFNVLEICDKLCSAFGHDILDALFSRSTSTTPSKRRFTRFTYFIISFIYICGHTLVLFYQLITLNVAINSYNNALLTLLLSNQFVELKGSVFKRFEKENVFQMSCSGILALL
jgi:hypothetical protein